MSDGESARDSKRTVSIKADDAENVPIAKHLDQFIASVTTTQTAIANLVTDAMSLYELIQGIVRFVTDRKELSAVERSLSGATSKLDQLTTTNSSITAKLKIQLETLSDCMNTKQTWSLSERVSAWADAVRVLSGLRAEHGAFEQQITDLKSDLIRISTSLRMIATQTRDAASTSIYGAGASVAVVAGVGLLMAFTSLGATLTASVGTTSVGVGSSLASLGAIVGVYHLRKAWTKVKHANNTIASCALITKNVQAISDAEWNVQRLQSIGDAVFGSNDSERMVQAGATLSSTVGRAAIIATTAVKSQDRISQMISQKLSKLSS